MIDRKKYINYIERITQTFNKKKENRNGQILCLNIKKKNEEECENTIIELKGRAAKFHKFSIRFWAKAVSQPKK